jgi:ribosome-binding factor A
LRLGITTALSQKLADPLLAELVVTAVDVTDDLGIADVGVRLLGDDATPRRRAVLRALRRAAPRLQRSAGASLGLKKVPVLRFRYDIGRDAAARVDELLREIAEESAEQSDDSGD